MSLTNSPIWFGSGATGGGFYGYEINDSLRFNDNDSPFLNRTPGSAGNQKTWTYSCWVKRANLGTYQGLIAVGTSDGDEDFFGFLSDDRLYFRYSSGSDLTSSQLFRDVSSWYHIVVVADTTQAQASSSASDSRLRYYVNGVQITAFDSGTMPSQNFDFRINSAAQHYIGEYPRINSHLDGYLAEVNFIDGQALDPTSFGETKLGVWIPKAYGGSYGTNGFHLNFSNNSTATNLGLDSSGNSNNWSVNGISTTDQMIDTPTNNFATLNPLLDTTGNITFSEGSLKTVDTNASTSGSSIAVSSGKWFAEMVCTAKTASNAMVGICTVDGFDSDRQLDESLIGGSGYGYVMNASKLPGGASYGATWAINDIIGIALDLDSATNTVTFYKNGSSQGSINIDNAKYVFCNSNGQGSSTVTYVSNFGQDSTFAGNTTAGGNSDANGNGDFKYAPPSGYLALCSANLPEPVVGPLGDSLSDENFNTVLYTGNGTSGQAITGVGFQPDFVWLKGRTASVYNHVLNDSVRGGTKTLFSNTTLAEYTDRGVGTFDTDGFTFTTYNGDTNNSGVTYVAWNWKAGGTAVSNTNGSITSQVSANTDAGFSVGTYTHNGSGGQTIGHGLSSAPEMVIIKQRSGGNDWVVFENSRPDTEKYLRLNSSGSYFDYGATLCATPGATTFELTYAPSGYTSDSGANYVFYCFHSVDGFSKVGSYTGNGSTDGSFVYTGFRPAYVMIKRSTSNGNWRIYDNKRVGYNVVDDSLQANLVSAEDTNNSFNSTDFVSNGFKLRGNAGGDTNDSGGTYIYLAFAENPFKYANAR